MSRHVVLVTRGTLGDILPFLLIGDLVRKAAADIELTILANENWRALCESRGFAFHPVCAEDCAQERWDELGLFNGGKDFYQDHFLDFFRNAYDFIMASSDRTKDIEVFSLPYAHGAQAACERLGVANHKILLHPNIVPTVRSPGFFAKAARLPGDRKVAIRERHYGALINRFRLGVGAPPMCDPGLNLYRGEASLIGFFPQWFAPPEAAWPANLVLTGFPEPTTATGNDSLFGFIREKGAPIVFSPGTGVSERADFLSVGQRLCADLDHPLVLITGGKGREAIRQGDNLFLIPYVDFGWLLPRAKILVHHGGIGSVAAAIRAGIPQIVRPERFDQPDNARRIEALGVGRMLRRRDFTANRLAHEIDRLTNDEPVSRALRQASCNIAGDQERLENHICRIIRRDGK